MVKWTPGLHDANSYRRIPPRQTSIKLLLFVGLMAWCPWAQATDVILLSSTQLVRTAEFDTLLTLYQQTLTDSEGLSSRYVEVDSVTCKNIFGIRAANMAHWRAVQRVIARIRERTGARYFLIFGGRLVIPRPTIPLHPEPETVEEVESDGWYLDFDGDRIVDEGLAIGRFADQGVAFGNAATFPSIDSLLASLRTAIVLHLRGGVTLDNPITFSPGEYETPPFGIGPECTEPALFLQLLSTADSIEFTGHGGINYFNNDSSVLVLDPDHLDPQLLQQNHPMVFAWGPCNSGRLLEMRMDSPPAIPFPSVSHAISNWPEPPPSSAERQRMDFMTARRISFFEEFKAEARLGDALFTAIRESTIEAFAIRGERGLITAQHFCLYGDPTLRLTPRLPANAHRPTFQVLPPGFPAPFIRENGLGSSKDRRFGPFAVGTDKVIIHVQVGGPAFIQQSIRGMTCTMLISTNAAFTGKISQTRGLFKPGHYPELDKVEFRFGPVQQAGQIYFRIQASNTLGTAQIPMKDFFSDDFYNLVFTGKLYPAPIATGWLVPAVSPASVTRFPFSSAFASMRA